MMYDKLFLGPVWSRSWRRPMPSLRIHLGGSDASAFLSDYFSSHAYRLALHSLPDLINLYEWDIGPALLALLSTILRFRRQSITVIKFFLE
jgi:hypothetical protein